MQQPQDGVICSLLNQRQEKGMEYLFARYYKPLVMWADAFLHDLSLSEDLVQDFFIRLWEKAGHKQLESETLKSFLYTSVRNLCFDRLEKKDPLRNSSDAHLIHKTWEEYDRMQDELMMAVRKEIDELPERSRQVIECVYLRGMRYKETAVYLGISVSTVNTLLVNALKKIRQKYSDDREIGLFLFLISKAEWLCHRK